MNLLAVHKRKKAERQILASQETTERIVVALGKSSDRDW